MDLNNTPYASSHPPLLPPRLPYQNPFTAHTNPPFLLLAPKRSTHAHIVDHPARRSGLVPCILLPHGLPRPALRCALWRKPDNRHAQRLSELGFVLTHYRQSYVRKSGISGRCGCVYEPETEEPRRPRVRSISDSLYLLPRSRWLAGCCCGHALLSFPLCVSLSVVDMFCTPMWRLRDR